MKNEQFVFPEHLRTVIANLAHQDRQLVIELYDFLLDEDCKCCLNLPILFSYPKPYAIATGLRTWVKIQSLYESRNQQSMVKQAMSGGD
ncbi:uncharacterized protein FTJAE_7969 [Fusarium tjaetaba]|uniref:Uncharacterized protein n=1 Tax=Fusarium tjaetaba TaxID=1567544 RepID=A0A8H5RDK2_9HYPO|nr:uncharacterized protein FTJAE_7969 [Fusarium tjaetaba]KAF5631103.1 hypothetical protein FTJAE_7969 [Fusarium tjaetaba]